jgi:LmbE family N-acetylglucosaminyl deacetylase
MSAPAAIAIGAHPDDIEFTMAGTLALLKKAGFRIHCLNIASGSCGSLELKPRELRTRRRRESEAAARILGADFHPSRTDDFQILYTLPLLRWLTGVIREVRPTVVLTHPPRDYMEDHMNTARLVVTATFARGMKNFHATSRAPVWSGNVAVYHAMPVGLQDDLCRPVVPGAFVNITSELDTKRKALACHRSQYRWLRETQGMASYLRTMEETSREVGRMSRKFRYAEGWWRHLPVGFCDDKADPLREALGSAYRINPAFKRGQ